MPPSSPRLRRFPEEIPLEATSVTAFRLRGEVAAARVERAGVQLGAELRKRGLPIAGEDVLDDVDPAVVVERHVYVPVRDEIHRRARARRAFDREADPVLPRPERAKRARKDRARALFRIAEETPGPPSRPDLSGGELEKIRGRIFELRGHQVDEGGVDARKRRPVEIVVRDEPFVLLPAVA